MTTNPDNSLKNFSANDNQEAAGRGLNYASLLSALGKLSLDIGAGLSVSQAGQKMIGPLCDTLSPHLALLYLYQDDALRLIASGPAQDPHRSGTLNRQKVGEGLYELTTSKGGAVYSSDPPPGLERSQKDFQKAGFNSFAALSLQSGQDQLGLLILAAKQTRDFRQEAEALEAFAHFIGMGLKNALLLEDAQRSAVERDLFQRDLQKTQEALKKSEEKFAKLFKGGPGWITLTTRSEGRFLEVSRRFCEMLGYRPEEVIGRSALELGLYPDPADRQEMIATLDRNGGFVDREIRFRAKNGEIRDLLLSAEALNIDGEACFALVASDITARKGAEAERAASLRFFASMDRINRAIAGSDDLEQMMSDVLDEVLAIFDCDRAWLLYPADPQASSWRVPMERTKPQYPGAFALGSEYPMDKEVAGIIAAVLAAGGPLRFDPQSSYPVPPETGENHGFKSLIAMALFPKTGKPWGFGLHQCSYARVWTPEDERLFQEIGRRLSDALSTLLVHRNLQESEERYRSLVDQASDVIMVLDEQGRILDVNNEAGRLFGCEQRELLGQNVYLGDADRLGELGLA